jgi:uncharacterized iron-regulated protein
MIAGVAFLAAPFAYAEVPEAALRAQVVVMGEAHDNPDHHRVQGDYLLALAPKAVVFEMLSPEQAALVTPEALQDLDALGRSLGWEEAGWPDFAIYAPVFAALGDAAVIGAAVSSEDARVVMEQGALQVFGEADAERFGIAAPRDPDEIAAQQELLRVSHCGALPEEMLPMMQDVQDYRDAVMAQAALEALDQTGGPVAIITGNGHARTDWGIPARIADAAPEVTVFSLGQGEDGYPPEGSFDLVIDGLGVARPDPCESFR